jgi:hypothetical protein
MKAFLLLKTFLVVATVLGAARPSFLWISAEDMSANLGCYGDVDARTPNVEVNRVRPEQQKHPAATMNFCASINSMENA